MAEKKEKTGVIDTYSFNAQGIPVTIKITRKPADYVPHYTISIPLLAEGTKIMLNALKADLITQVKLDVTELIDPKQAADVRRKFERKAGELLDKQFVGVSPDKKPVLISYLLQHTLGLGELEILMGDENLEDIAINGPDDPIWIYHKKHGWCKTNLWIRRDETIYEYSSMVGRKSGRQINILNPIMNAHLPTGDRVNATLSPISTFGNTISIRKFAKNPWTIPYLIEVDTVSPEVSALIWLCVQNEISLLCSGGAGSGKTSFLNAISCMIPPNQRVISIEDTRELTLPDFLQWIAMTTREPNPEGKGEVCLFPGSMFVDGDGALHEISEYVEERLQTRPTERPKENVTIAQGFGDEVLAGDPNSFNYGPEKVSFISKITDRDKICTIFCNNGETIRLTENTKIPVVNEVGEIKLLTPGEIEEGKYYLPSLTHIRAEGKIQRIDPFDSLSDFYLIDKKIINDLIDELKKRKLLVKAAKKMGIKHQAFSWYKKKGIMKLSHVEKALALCGLNRDLILDKIEEIKARGSTAKPIRIPKVVDEELAYLAGFVLAEKCLTKNGIKIAQKTEIQYIVDIVRRLFGVETEIRKDNGYFVYLIPSVVVRELMRRIFSAEKAEKIRVPKVIMKSSDGVIASFLAGFIDGDGSICKTKISLATKSELAAKEFRYLLLRLGVFSRLLKSKKVFEIDISTREDMKRICEIAKFRIKEKTAKASAILKQGYGHSSKRSRVPAKIVEHLLEEIKHDKALRRQYYKAKYYGTNADKMLIAKISEESLDEKLDEKVQNIISFVTRPDIELVKISEVKIEENKENIPTYDVTPEKSKYFVAGINNFTLVMDTMLELLVNSLRQRPDRILVGEVRRQREAEVLFEAIHTGHSVYATMHADNAAEAITRLTTPPINLPKSVLPALGGIIIQYRNRRTGIRRTFEFAEITKESEANVLYRWDPKEDTQKRVGTITRLGETLALYTGMTQKEMQQDLTEKAKVLKWMVGKKYFGIDVVGKIIADYYIKPDEVLAAAKKNKEWTV